MIICIVGLPCSGKTYLSSTIGKYFNLPIVDNHTSKLDSGYYKNWEE